MTTDSTTITHEDSLLPWMPEHVPAYTGTVTSGSTTVTTNIFTDEFDSVRVTLST